MNYYDFWDTKKLIRPLILSLSLTCQKHNKNHKTPLLNPLTSYFGPTSVCSSGSSSGVHCQQLFFFLLTPLLSPHFTFLPEVFYLGFWNFASGFNSKKIRFEVKLIWGTPFRGWHFRFKKNANCLELPEIARTLIRKSCCCYISS